MFDNWSVFVELKVNLQVERIAISQIVFLLNSNSRTKLKQTEFKTPEDANKNSGLLFCLKKKYVFTWICNVEEHALCTETMKYYVVI